MAFETRDTIVSQSGVVAWRRTASGLRVMLVTSRSGQRWVIPKGGLEPGMTPAESAANEAEEEAGLLGHVAQPALGHYCYSKGGMLHLVEVFAMQVTEVLDEWREMDQRTRRWMPPRRAAQLVWEADLGTLLLSLEGRIRPSSA